MGLLNKMGTIGQIIGVVLGAVAALVNAPAGALIYQLAAGTLVASTIAVVIDPPQMPKFDNGRGGGGHAFGAYFNAADALAEVR